MLDQNGRRAFDQLIQLFVPEQKSHHYGIDHQQRRCADQSSRHGVVVSDDGVLHGVGECEEHDEIKWIELRQFALACQAQPDHQE